MDMYPEIEIKDNWTVLQTNHLIAGYKRFPNLWDINNKYYRNKDLRKTCLKAIAQQLQSLRPGTTTIDIRGKLKTLRSQHGKEKRRKELHDAKRSGEEYRPKLWCYDDIKFIDVERKYPYENQSQNAEQNTTQEDDIEMSESLIAEFLDDQPADKKIDVPQKPPRLPRLSNWTKEQTLVLLQLLRKRPLLFDNTHPHYANFCQRAKAFHEILYNLRHKKPDVTVPEMRSKLKTLRSQYVKEKRLLARSAESKSRKPYVPKLWCFEQCKFLDDRGKFLEDEREEEMKLKSESEYEDVQQQPDDCYVMENENEIYVKSFDEVEIIDEDVDMSNGIKERVQENHVNKSDRKVLQEKCLALVESLTNQMLKHTESDTSTNTPQALLGKMVETELSKVSEEIFEETKWKIIKLLEESAKKDRVSKLRVYKNV